MPGGAWTHWPQLPLGAASAAASVPASRGWWEGTGWVATEESPSHHGNDDPEQAFGAKLDLRADLWALATVSYEALTGELPLRGESVPEMMCSLCAGNLISVHHRRPDLPPGLAAFYDRAFARKIDARFTSATELAVAFARAVGQHRTTVRASRRKDLIAATWSPCLGIHTLLFGRPRHVRTGGRRNEWR